MEILYLWVDRINNVIDKEFQFSNEFSISFEKQNKSLKLSKTNFNKLELFDKSFLNITAIIGINGSGKSSLFSVIKTLFSDNFYNYLQYIVVLKTLDNQILIIDKFSKEGENINEEKELEDGTKILIEHNNEVIFDKISLIFQSNSFTIYESEIFRHNFLDISFNYSLDRRSIASNELLLKRVESAIEYYHDKPDKKEDFETTKALILRKTLPRDQIYRYDLLANVDFISDYYNENWDFVPKYLEISFNEFFFYNNQQYFKEIGLANIIDNISFLLFKKENTTFQPEDIKTNFKNSLIISLFLYCIVHDQYFFPRNEELGSAIKSLGKESNVANLPKMVLDFLLKTKSSFPDHPLTSVNEFISTLDVEFDTLNISNTSYSNYYLLPLNDKVSETLRKVFKIWLDPEFIFTFSWQNLSAGEAALLNLFSKIKTISAEKSFNSTIWLLIDEGELYLHPEWQRTFFINLHKYLPLFFKDKKIQLIFTSHSPFVISDLPKENIIFLDRIDGLCKVIHNDSFKETFGSNIHELFTNQFFLNEGLIGEFAKQKINDSIKFLKFNPLKVESESNIKSTEEWTKEKVENFIKIIGEPLIAERLQKLFDEKYKTKEDIEKRIASLLEELKQTPK